MEHGLVQVDARDDKEYYQLTEPAQVWLGNPRGSVPGAHLRHQVHGGVGPGGGERGEDDEEAPIPWALAHLVQDETDPVARLAQLRQTRELMGRRLEELDREIEIREEVMTLPIEVKDLVKVYNGDIRPWTASTAVEEGEIFGFLGPNGAGGAHHHIHADHIAAAHRGPGLRRRHGRASP